jgi:hypothetical protein
VKKVVLSTKSSLIRKLIGKNLCPTETIRIFHQSEKRFGVLDIAFPSTADHADLLDEARLSCL